MLNKKKKGGKLELRKKIIVIMMILSVLFPISSVFAADAGKDARVDEWHGNGWDATYNHDTNVTLIKLVPEKYSVHFNINNSNATGELKDANVEVGQDFKMPTKSFVSKDGFVKGFSKNKNSKEPEYKPGESYKDVFQENEKGILYAIWEPFVKGGFQDGEIEFYLKDGQNVLFDKLPANTSYEVYEYSKAGWHLVSTDKDRGRILPADKIISTFTNKYEPNTTYLTINGQKLINGEVVDNKGYEFELFINRGLKVKATSDDNGNFKFGPIKYKRVEDGGNAYIEESINDSTGNKKELNAQNEAEFEYKVKELSPSTDSIKKDESVYTVKVKVKDNGKGELTVNSDIVGSKDKTLIFNNTRKTTSLTINKEIVSNSLSKEALEKLTGDFAQEFTVEVQLSNESKPRIVKLHKDKDEDNNFKATIVGLLPGTKYEIKEINIPDGYSVKEYKNQTGTLKSTGENTATVVNEYKTSGSFKIAINKELIGRELQNEEFTFNLLRNGQKIASAKNNAQGIVNTFGAITLKKDGEYTFTIEEDKSNIDESVEYDDNKIEFTVNAIDDGKGNLTIEGPAYKNDKKTFTNKIKPGTLNITKTVKNIVTDDIFTLKLTLLDKNDKPLTKEYTMTSNMSDKEQKVTNGSIITIKSNETLTIPDLPDGSKYKVEEINISSSDSKTDKNSEYKLKEIKNQEGLITSNAVSDVEVVNAYKQAGTYQIKGSKTFTGKYQNGEDVKLEKGQFEFLLLNKDGSIADRATNDENGNFAFKPIKFTEQDVLDQEQKGLKQYRVIESTKFNPQKESSEISEENIKFDMSEYRITVELSKEGEVIKVKDKIMVRRDTVKDIKFNNEYDESKVNFKITKNVVGETSASQEFNVNIGIQKPNEEKTTRVVKIKNGETISYKNLPAGTKIWVEEFGLPKEYDESKVAYTLEKGNENTKITFPLELKDKTNNINIENTKIISGEYLIKGLKTVNDKFPGDSRYTFILKDKSKKEIAEKRTENDKFGNIKFKINFTEEDLNVKDDASLDKPNKVFYIEEINERKEGIVYDTTKYKVTLILKKDNDSNILVEKMDIKKQVEGQEEYLGADKIKFNNKDVPTSDLPSTGSKLMLGSIVGVGIAAACYFAITGRKNKTEK